MSLDEIRRKVREAQDIPRDERRFTPDGKAHLDPDDVEALCDLASGARRWINAAERMDINEVARAEAAIRTALARLDEEETG